MVQVYAWCSLQLTHRALQDHGPTPAHCRRIELLEFQDRLDAVFLQLLTDTWTHTPDIPDLGCSQYLLQCLSLHRREIAHLAELRRVPIDVFRALDCSSILLIRSPVAVLLERLHARLDTSWTEAELSEFSMAEDVHSAEVAEVLRIPLKILDSPSVLEVEAWLDRFSKGAGVYSR
jgi:hypothetical protein